MRMKNPPHPGESVLHLCIEPLGLSVEEVARHLEFDVEQLKAVVEARAPITPELAVRLRRAFGGGDTIWLRMQAAYDLAQEAQAATSIKDRWLRFYARLTPKRTRDREIRQREEYAAAAADAVKKHACPINIKPLWTASSIESNPDTEASEEFIYSEEFIRAKGHKFMPMKNSPHPGKNLPHPGLFILHDCLEPFDLSIAEAARRIGVNDKQLADVVEGSAPVTPELATNIRKAFGGDTEIWLRLQDAYDRAQATAPPKKQHPEKQHHEKQHHKKRQNHAHEKSSPSRVVYSP